MYKLIYQPCQQVLYNRWQSQAPSANTLQAPRPWRAGRLDADAPRWAFIKCPSRCDYSEQRASPVASSSAIRPHPVRLTMPL